MEKNPTSLAPQQPVNRHRIIHFLPVPSRHQRSRVDIELHLGRISYRDAVARLQEVPGLEVDAANCELTQIALDPGAASAAVLAADLLDHAVGRRAETTGEERGAVRDGLLAAGPVAVPLALRRCYGESEWSRIRGEAGL